jgi:aspartate kinase
MSFDRILKFGGVALADGPAVQRACRIVREHGGPRPIVVVSAHQGVTDLLDTVGRSALEGHLEGDRVRIRHRTLLRQLELDPELLDRYFTELFGLLAEVGVRRRLLSGQLDHLLAFGERMSARIVAQALSQEGLRATPVDAWDIGLVTDSNFGDARPLPVAPSQVRAALEQVGGIPVVTGFLAKDTRGNLTTMGRNGSDLTAALLAEAVGAAEVQLWKGVGGMMTADPDLVPDARVIERLGFQEAAEYAFHGAEVLYGPAITILRRSGVSVRMLDARRPSAPGTVLEARTHGEGPVGIAARRALVRVDLALEGGELRAPRCAELFGALARHRVEPGLVSSQGERVGAYVAPASGLESALGELGRRASVVRDLALLAVIGRDVGQDTTLATRALDLLAAQRVEVREAFVGSRVPSQAFVVPAADLARAACALHAGLLRPQGAVV